MTMRMMLFCTCWAQCFGTDLGFPVGKTCTNDSRSSRPEQLEKEIGQAQVYLADEC